MANDAFLDRIMFDLGENDNSDENKARINRMIVRAKSYLRRGGSALEFLNSDDGYGIVFGVVQNQYDGLEMSRTLTHEAVQAMFGGSE